LLDAAMVKFPVPISKVANGCREACWRRPRGLRRQNFCTA